MMRKHSIFTHIYLSVHRGVPHVMITHDALDLPPGPIYPWASNMGSPSQLQPTPLDIRHWTPQPWHLGAITGDLFKRVHLRTVRIVQSWPCPHGHQTRIPWHRPLLVTTGGDYWRPVWTCSLDNPPVLTSHGWSMYGCKTGNTNPIGRFFSFVAVAIIIGCRTN